VTQPIRFVFDECALGRCTVERELRDSLALFGADAELAHLLSKFPPGTKDEVWIPHLAHDGDWIIFSADLGKNSKKSESLPLICQALGVTHIIMSPALQRRPSFYRVLAISSCWTQILGTAEAAKGTGFTLSMSTGKKGQISFRFQEWHKPTTAVLILPVQQQLF